MLHCDTIVPETTVNLSNGQSDNLRCCYVFLQLFSHVTYTKNTAMEKLSTPAVLTSVVREDHLQKVWSIMAGLHLAASVSGSWYHEGSLSHCHDLLVYLNRIVPSLIIVSNTSAFVVVISHNVYWLHYQAKAVSFLFTYSLCLRKLTDCIKHRENRGLILGHSQNRPYFIMIYIYIYFFFRIFHFEAHQTPIAAT